MTITLNGTTGITTPAVTNNGAYTGDGVVFADGTPSNTLVTDTSGNVGIGTTTPTAFAGFAPILDLKGTAPAVVFHDTTGSAINFTIAVNGNQMDFYNDSTSTSLMALLSGGNLQFNSGYGSVATAYGCRAWVNFNGTGTVAIRTSGNVSSITDVGTGNYRVNFTNAMPDTNYGVVGGNDYYGITIIDTYNTSSVKVYTTNNSFSNADCGIISVCVFR